MSSSSVMASFSHTNIHTLPPPLASPSVRSPFSLHQVCIPVTVSSGLIYLRSKKRQLLRFCSVDNHNHASESADFVSSSGESKGNDVTHQRGSLSPNEILERLRRYGIAGILSYGLLNTAYYLTTFLVVWFYVAPAPGRMGYLAAVERFVKVMAMVWAGSQVTKLFRAGGALALAPLVDKGLSWFTIKFKFESQGKAFLAIAGFCFFLAFLLFLLVTLLGA